MSVTWRRYLEEATRFHSPSIPVGNAERLLNAWTSLSRTSHYLRGTTRRSDRRRISASSSTGARPTRGWPCLKKGRSPHAASAIVSGCTGYAIGSASVV